METITIMDEMLFQWQTEFLKIVSWTIILIFSNRKFRVIDNNGIVHKFVAVTNREETSANGYCKDVHHTNMLDGEFLTVVRHITEVATCYDVFFVPCYCQTCTFACTKLWGFFFDSIELQFNVVVSPWKFNSLYFMFCNPVVQFLLAVFK